MSNLHMMITFIIALTIIFFSNEKFESFFNEYFNVGSKQFKQKKLKQSKDVRKLLKKQQFYNCKNLTNNTENITYLINRRAYCRFIDAGLIANKNDIKSWSS